MSQQDKAKAVALSFHGDEGESKKQRPILILSWSSLGIHGEALKTKIPFAILHSSEFYYDPATKKNLTLQSIQQQWVRMMNACTNIQENCEGYSMWMVGGKGDWKFKKEWLQESRNYSTSQICRRCLADYDTKPWTDVGPNACWDSAADRLIAMETAVPENAPRLAEISWMYIHEVPYKRKMLM